MNSLKMPELILDVGVNYYEIAQKLNISYLDAAKLMIKEAALSGVTTVKFQTYKAEKLAAIDSPAYWNLKEEPTASQRELFLKYDKFNFVDYFNLSEYCGELGIEFMSTAFDYESSQEINRIVKRHKIASADVTNIELLSVVSKYKKPVILSIGASTKGEVDTAVKVLQNGGVEDITLLHCVLNYPTEYQNSNLQKIDMIKRMYNNIRVGYSDHCKFDVDVLTTSWLLGAEIIEKHFTLDNTIKGNDHYHAIIPNEIKFLYSHFKKILEINGKENIWLDYDTESVARENARRGVYLKRDVRKDDFICTSDVEFLRPQKNGISPMQWADKILKKEKYTEDMKKGEQII